MATHRLFTIGALLVALLLTACQPIQPPAATTATPDSIPGTEATTINEVTITATEYSFDAPESIPAGWNRITLVNQGELPHDLLLFRIEEGRTLDDVMAALEAEGPPEWAEFFGSATAEGGGSNWFASNLSPGTYVYLSFGEGEDGPPDAAQGMIGTLEVTEASGPIAETPPINEDVSIEMVDFQFIVNGTISADEQVLRLSNTGTEMHEVIFFRLHEGNTIDDFMALLEQEMGSEAMAEEDATPATDTTPSAEATSTTTPNANATPSADSTPSAEAAPDVETPGGEPEMPGDFVGGVFLSPGIVSYSSMTFEPGTYVLVCFIPSPEHDMMPHVALGMIQQVIVE
jgi:hypothetical protein